jgi:hypothetical protein
LLLQKYKYRAQESALASATDNDDTATDALQQATATGSVLYSSAVAAAKI